MGFLSAIGLVLILGMVLAGCTQDPVIYSVTFDAGDGTGTPPEAKKVEDGESITLPGKGSLTATDKEFDGWKAGGQIYQIGDSYTVTADVTFVAQWKAAEKKEEEKKTEMKVYLTHSGQNYKDEIISRITIYKGKDSKDGTKVKDYYPNLKYGETWEDGVIAEIGEYYIEIYIAGINYTQGNVFSIFDLAETLRLSYDGTAVKKL
jgi:hypothetical protein